MNGRHKLLKIYIGESISCNGKALYHEIIKRIKEQGLEDATTVLGIESYGTGKRTDPAVIEEFAYDLPVTIEVVSFEEKIKVLNNALKGMAASSIMLTVQNV
jgi:PII-like signaling protein